VNNAVFVPGSSVFSDDISTFPGEIAKLNTPAKVILVATFAVFRGNLRESAKRPKCLKALMYSRLRAHVHTRERTGRWSSGQIRNRSDRKCLPFAFAKALFHPFADKPAYLFFPRNKAKITDRHNVSLLRIVSSSEIRLYQKMM